MDIKEFVEKTVLKYDEESFDSIKVKIIGEYIKLFVLDEGNLKQDVFAEKLSDCFEMVHIRTNKKFEDILLKYVTDLDEVVKKYIPAEPSAKKDEVPPPTARSRQYYKHAMEIKGSRSLTIKQITEYSRIMMSLYMGAINAGMKEVEDYEFPTESLSLDKIIEAMKSEKSGWIGPIGSKKLFDLSEPYGTDTSTFIITMIMYYHIKGYEIKGEN